MKKFLFTLAALVATGLAMNAQIPTFGYSESEINLAPGENQTITIALTEDAGQELTGGQMQFIMYDDQHNEISEGVIIDPINIGTPRAPKWVLFNPGAVINDLGTSLSESKKDGCYRALFVSMGGDPILMGDEVEYYTSIGAVPALFSINIKIEEGYEGAFATLELESNEDMMNVFVDASQTKYFVDQEMCLKINNTAYDPGQQTQDFAGEIIFGEIDEAGNVPVSYNGPEEGYTLTVTVDGVEVEIVDGMINLGTYGDHEVKATVALEGYNTIERTKIFTWEEPVVEVTATPVINYDEETFTITVEGAGEIHCYVDGEEVDLPYTFEQGETDVTYVVTATAQEEGKEISETTTLEVVVPAKVVVPEVTEAPVINYDAETFTITVEGAGEIHCYVDGEEVELPYTFEQGDEEVTYVVTATAQEEGKEISETATLEVVVPAKAEPQPEVTPTPEIVITETDDAIIIDVIGEGEIHVYVNGEEVEIPCTIEKGDEPQDIVITATAQGEDMEISETATQDYTIPAKGETPEDPYATGFWLVTIDKNGDEVWTPMTVGSDEDGYQTSIAFTYRDYGTFDWQEGDNEEARPNVAFYVVIDGAAYGPEADATVPVFGDANMNPLFVNENMWGAPLGYKYVIGVVKNVIDGKYYLQISKGGFVGLDEINAGKTVANVRYFNMAGQEMQEANGMTIVVTTFTDGTTNAVKVMK